MTSREATRSPSAAIQMAHLVELIKTSNATWSRVDRLRDINDRVNVLNGEAEQAQVALREEAAKFRSDLNALGVDIDKMLQKTDRFTTSLDKKRDILRAHLHSNHQLYTVFKLMSVTSAFMLSEEACRLQCEFYASYKPEQIEPTQSQVQLEQHLVALQENAGHPLPNLDTARHLKDICCMVRP